MIKSNRNARLIWCAVLLMVVLMGCEKPAEVPPPENARAILQHVKDGYNNEDVELFTSDFADIMFTKGFTIEAWRDTMKKVKKNLGEWKSERADKNYGPEPISLPDSGEQHGQY